MAEQTRLEHALDLARRLPLDDQARLLMRLAALMQAARAESAPQRPRLRGMLADLGPAPSAEEIDAARHEMWRSSTTDS